MEIEKLNLEFDNEEISNLIKKLNSIYNNQQFDFSNLCYTIYKIDCWFDDHPDEVILSNTKDYFNKKKLFKTLGFTTKQINRYNKCYQRYMTLTDKGPILKEQYFLFTSSKLFEMLTIDIKLLDDLIIKGDISSSMTVKEIREYIKKLNEDTPLPEDDEDEANQISTEEDKYYVLKNDTMRKDFLDNYKTWGLWFEEPRLKLKYYRCKFGDKVLVVINGICDYGTYTYGERYKEDYKFYYMTPAGELVLDPTCISQIIKDMSAVEDKRVYLF